MDSVDLLRQFAPQLRFDSRELFFPAPVEPYVAEASLRRGDVELKPPGSLTCDDLGVSLGHGVSLRFISEEDRKAVVKAEASRIARKLLSPRLGRVGIFGRILDAIFLLSVFVRPTTPRRTTTAAALKSRRLKLDDHPTVYGRVLHQGEWIVLHYSYFYVMNDWRTGYRGVNDHEADWEQAWIFLDPADMSPQWLAASSHDHAGPDLRRHWDDPEVVKTDDGRAVLFAGAGSHALYFQPGDYVTRIDVPGTRWALRIQRWIQGLLRISDQATERGLGPALGVPFVDSALGDGRQISVWDMVEVTDETCFISDYRGLWGLDTGDPTEGERGPSGPKFQRDGSMRSSWVDPLGFAGLSGTPPPTVAGLRLSPEKMNKASAVLSEQIAERGRLLPLIAAENEHGTVADKAIEVESAELTELLRQRATVEDLARHIADGSAAKVNNRAHLTHPAVPLPPPKGAGWLLALWAALSVPALLVLMAAIIFFDSVQLAGVGLLIGAVVVLIEQLVRRRFHAVFRLSLVYAIVFLFGALLVTGVLIAGRFVIAAALIGAAFVLFIANISELTAVSAGRTAAKAASDRSRSQTEI